MRGGERKDLMRVAEKGGSGAREDVTTEGEAKEDS